MATARDVITTALENIQVRDVGQEIPAEDVTLALARLNDLLASLNDGLTIYDGTELSASTVIPIPDNLVRALAWALSGEIAAAFGATLSPDDRFKADRGWTRLKGHFMVLEPVKLWGHQRSHPYTRPR